MSNSTAYHGEPRCWTGARQRLRRRLQQAVAQGPFGAIVSQEFVEIGRLLVTLRDVLRQAAAAPHFVDGFDGAGGLFEPHEPVEG